eukprot:54650-Rhodomonas_salina.1
MGVRGEGANGTLVTTVSQRMALVAPYAMSVPRIAQQDLAGAARTRTNSCVIPLTPGSSIPVLVPHTA